MSDRNKFLARFGHDEHLNKALDDTIDHVRRVAIKNPNATKEHLDKALSDPNDSVRAAVARNPNANKEHLDKALSYDQPGPVRLAAASNPNANKEHLDKALSDPEWYVRDAARTRLADKDYK